MTAQNTAGSTDPPTTSPPSTAKVTTGSEWWRSAAIYQIYPRSFADATGDGMGDLPGISKRLPALALLGIDAVWLSPFYTSPQNDAGYDVADYCAVDPRFGTLADFASLEEEAHALGLRLIVDLVPNHTSDQHVWFKEALAAPEGGNERARYMFRDGKGANGDIPPNNWESVFGGPAWTRVTRPDGTRGQWYLHLFDTSQPDLNWENPWVREQFLDILRFWLDRGVDGFRIDVAHGLIKAAGLPDYTAPVQTDGMGDRTKPLDPKKPKAEKPGALAELDQGPPTPPYWAQDGVHEIYRDWRRLIDSYPGERVLVAEAWVEPLTMLARWVRPDEMNQAFNFAYLGTHWAAPDIRSVIDESLSAFAGVGAPSTWVLSNHDVVRHATRLALTEESPQGYGLGPKSPGRPIPALGLKRARAATSLMLALPGSAYLYQGEELGLPEDIDLPDSARQDPTWFRTKHERYGRDGCRVPIPWEADQPSYGFSTTGKSWLPQPKDWAPYARSSQLGVPGSTLELYRLALALRAQHNLGLGSLEWLPGYGEDVVAFRNGAVTVLANIGQAAVELPRGELLLASEKVSGGLLPGDTTVWIRIEP
ncbi:MAG: glycoside hydrolase family 13 protein [Lacisediminihabitans sp.]